MYSYYIAIVSIAIYRYIDILSQFYHTRDQISQVFPVHIWIPQMIKTGSGEDLKMRQRAANFHHFCYTASDQNQNGQSWNKDVPWGKTDIGAVSVPFWSSQLTAKSVKLYCNPSCTSYSWVLTLEPTHRELAGGYSGLLLMQYWSMLSSLRDSVHVSVSRAVLPVPSVSVQEEEGAGGVAVEWRTELRDMHFNNAREWHKRPSATCELFCIYSVSVLHRSRD